MCKNHFYTFIWAPNTQIEDMFINTESASDLMITLNGGRSGLMQETNRLKSELQSYIHSLILRDLYVPIVNNIYHTV